MQRDRESRLSQNKTRKANSLKEREEKHWISCISIAYNKQQAVGQDNALTIYYHCQSVIYLFSFSCT
ncbi:unnamed protein product [Periconia digitata]|uniref:Uncharacterized protein n=1 Tax=Periconia digitata TaxID=1303443 RepID=A0A9W4UIW0_9PLEO|nr:unnamed protein product [Periconia digitata]